MTHTATTEADVTLRAGSAELTVEPHNGCRIASLQIGGTELLRQGEQVRLLPDGALVRPDRTRAGSATAASCTNCRSTPRRTPSTAPAATPPGAPPGADESEAVFTYDLATPGRTRAGSPRSSSSPRTASLTLTMGVETYADSFPAQAGWHPWFLRNLGDGSEDVRIDFDAGVAGGARRRPPPDRQAHRPRAPAPGTTASGCREGVDVTLTWPEQLELKVASRAEWVVVYDEQEEAVCVEPQTGPAQRPQHPPRAGHPASSRWRSPRPGPGARLS